MVEIKTNLRSLKEMENQNATEQEEKQNCNVSKVKFPKLVISRFIGTVVIWFRFWKQFKSVIDRSKLPAVSKCSCLNFLQSKGYHRRVALYK